MTLLRALPGLGPLLIDADGLGTTIAMDGLDEAQVCAVDANGIAMVGDTMTFQLQITNTGSVTVTELNLVDKYDPTILQYISALIAPDSQVAGTITWASVDGDGSSLDANLPLAPGVSFIITVEFAVIGVTRP